MFKQLSSGSFWKRTLAIMLPAAAQQLISIGVNMMDSLMIGSFGETQIAASSLANQLTSLAIFILMGLGTGANVMAAQFWGRGDRSSLKYIASVALRLSVLIGVILAMLALVFPKFTMGFFSSEATIIAKGSEYFRYFGWSLPLYSLTTAATYLLRSTRHTKIPLIASVCAFFINIFFNWVFIFGKFGAPRMELAGAAVGTLIARAFEFCMVFIYLLKYDKNISLRPKDLFLSNPALFKQYIKYSLPLLLSDTLLGFGLITNSAIVGHMGESVTAANSIVLVLNQFVTVLNIGLSNAAGVVIGNSIGEGELDRAFKEGLAFIFVSFCIGLIAMIIILLIYPWFMSLYNISDIVREDTRILFLSLCSTMPFATVAYVSSKGVLRGAGDTRFIMIADSLLLWVVSIPLGAITGLVLHWPLFWVYFLLRFEYPAKGVWCTIRFLRGKSIQVIKAEE